MYMLKHKSELFERFKEFKAKVEKGIANSIKTPRSNPDGKYLSLEFKIYLYKCGIVAQLYHPRTPQWDGASGRRDRTLLDTVRSIMNRANLLISLWGYVLGNGCIYINRVLKESGYIGIHFVCLFF